MASPSGTGAGGICVKHGVYEGRVCPKCAAPSGTGHDTARYEIGVLIGPCSQAECEALMEAILDLPEAAAVGGVVSCGPWKEPDPPVAVPDPASASEQVAALIRKMMALPNDPGSRRDMKATGREALALLAGADVTPIVPDPASVSPAEPQHKWVKAPASLLAAYVCSVCGRDSMVKFYGRCSGAR